MSVWKTECALVCTVWKENKSKLSYQHLQTTHTCSHTHTCALTDMHPHMHECTHVCTHVRARTHTHTHTHTHTYTITNEWTPPLFWKNKHLNYMGFWNAKAHLLHYTSVSHNCTSIKTKNEINNKERRERWNTPKWGYQYTTIKLHAAMLALVSYG